MGETSATRLLPIIVAQKGVLLRRPNTRVENVRADQRTPCNMIRSQLESFSDTLKSYPDLSEYCHHNCPRSAAAKIC